jgi:hypothetical protein
MSSKFVMSEMRTAIKYNLVALFLVVSCLVTYALWKVECPFCHAGNIDASGQCELGNECQNLSVDEVTGESLHFNAGSCPWCSSTGKMTNLDIILD